jgi:outer membrane protein TolC
LAGLPCQYGVSDFLTVLDDEGTIVEPQRQLAQSETAATIALVAVYDALGGAWQ